MKFRVKDVDLASGGPLVAILNIHDAERLDLHSGDRILVTYKKRKTTCILNISETKNAVSPGSLGLFEEVLDELRISGKATVELDFTGKPESVNHIRDKLYGKRLNSTEILHIIDDITHDRLSSVEKTYFVAGGFANGWSVAEVVAMAEAMVKTGQKLKFKGITLDKHCIGGVPGNRTTMIVIPIIAAAGFTIPKTSSRAITSPAGTADTMECLAKVEFPEEKIKKIVKATGASIVHGGSMNLAPADDKIIEVEHPLSIDAEGQLLASVMAKKFSVSANHVLIDIPMGPQVKAKTSKQARHLKKMFQIIGKKLGMHVKVIITDGTQPIGYGIGPLLEAEDVMAVLRNDPLAPEDLRRKSLSMATHLLEMAGVRKPAKVARHILTSGKALAKMEQIIKAQGKQKRVQLGEHRYQVKSSREGKVTAIDNHIISKIATVAGAPHDKGAGLYLHKKVRDKVKKNKVLYDVYAESKFKLNLAKKFVKKGTGYTITQ
jgi:putative thymidine phosphorylase